MTRVSRDDVLAYLAVAVVAIVLVWVGYHGRALLGHPDGTEIFAPFALDASLLVQREGLHGLLFDPYVLAGYSQWQNANYHPIYPLFFNWLGSDSSLSDTLSRLEFVIRLHLVWYALGLYFMSRRLGASKLAGFVIAAAAPWMPAAVSTTMWPHIVAAVSWIPWVLGFNIAVARRPGFSVPLAVGLALSASMLIYAQPAQTMVITVLGCVMFWGVVLGAAFLRRTDSPSERMSGTVATLALAGLITCCLSGYYLFTLLDFHANTIRWLGRYGEIVGNQAIPLDAMREWGYRASDMVGLISPDQGNTKDVGNLFLGIPVLFLAAAALVNGRDPVRWALLAIACMSLALASQWLAPLTIKIPAAGKVRQLAWWTCLMLTVCLPLAAMGIDRLNASIGQKSWQRALLAALVVTALAGLSAGDNLPLAVAVVGTGAVLIAMLTQSPRMLAAACFALPLMVLAYAVPGTKFPLEGRAAAEAATECCADMEAIAKGAAAAFTEEQKLSYRFAVDPSVPNQRFLAHLLASHGLRMIRGNVHPQDYDKFRLLFFPSLSVSRIYGVKYVLQKDAEGGWQWQEQAGALPRAYFVAGTPTLKGDAVDFLLDRPRAPVTSLVVESAPPEGAAPDAGGPAAGQIIAAKFDKLGPLSATGTITASGPGYFVWNEAPQGSWVVRINGEEREWIPVNGYQIGVALPRAGSYRFEVTP
ncbi:hypothetical protein V1318_06635 [Lysobacter sp. CCNWLW3]|uniref:hypothetical protein n=1 Tax=unclassified Lysobacter TaxID=2635362 RepID=UPI002FD583BB